MRSVAGVEAVAVALEALDHVRFRTSRRGLEAAKGEITTDEAASA